MLSGTPLFALLAALTAPSALAADAAGSCPVSKESLRSLPTAQMEQLCMKPVQAQGPVRNPGGRMAGVRRCYYNLVQAKESANVEHATTERQKMFHPDIQGYVDQKTAGEKAAHVLFSAHAFTNVSMAALYRSRLKIRQAVGQSKDQLQEIKTETERTTQSRNETVQAEQNARAQGNPSADRLRDEAIPAFERDFKAIQATEKVLHDSLSCLERQQEALDKVFDDWAGVKKGLLGQSFVSLVTEDSYPMAIERNNTKVLARVLQNQQQQVYDTLTDPSKRSTAYRLAEGCHEKGCETWATAASAAGWVARTPVIGIVAKSISGGAAFLRANGQGLGFWDSLKETGNAVTPFQVQWLDTEVGAIEKGEARPFQPGA